MVSGADQQVVVELIAKPEKLKKGFGQANQATKKFSGAIKALKLGLVAAAAAITAAIVVTKKLMKSFTEYALKIDKINKVTGMSCESLQRWGYVALQEHGNFETLTKSFTILAQRIVDADQGLETYTREFRKMGIELRDQQGNLRDVNDVFMDMGDYAKTATNQTEAMGTMGKILGSRYVKDLLPMLKLSREEIERLGDEAEKLGIVLDTKTIRAAKAFDDKLTKMKEGLRGVGLQIAEKMLPAFEKIIDAFDASEMGVSGLADSIGSLANSLADFVSGEGQSFLAFLRECITGISVVMDYLAGEAVGKKGFAEKLAGMNLEELVGVREDIKARIKEGETALETAGGFQKKALKDQLKIFEDMLEAVRKFERERRKTPLIIEGPYGVSLPEKEKGAIGSGDGGAGVGGVGKAATEKAPEVSDAKLLSDALVDIYTQGLDERADASQTAWEAEVVRAAAAMEKMEARMEVWANVIGQSLRFLSSTFGQFWNTLFQPLFTKLNEAETAWGKFGASIVKSLTDLLKQVVEKVVVYGGILAGIVTVLNAIAPGLGNVVIKLLGMGGDWEGFEGGFGETAKKILGFKGSKQAGGEIEETGLHQLHKGEWVIPKRLTEILGSLVGLSPQGISAPSLEDRFSSLAATLSQGVQGALQPAFAGGGMPARTIVVRLPDPVGALAEVYEETEPHSQQRFGRATRKAAGKDKEAD